MYIIITAEYNHIFTFSIFSSIHLGGGGFLFACVALIITAE